MTNKEAIEILKKLMYPPTRADGKSMTHLMANVAIETAINALERQKCGTWKPHGKSIGGRYTLWKCSVCSCIIFSEDEQDRTTFHKYCGFCGAKMEDENAVIS